jgi:hypothetical protein
MQSIRFLRVAIILLAVVAAVMSGCKKDEDTPITPPGDHFEPEGAVITEGGDTILVYFQGTVRTGDTLRAPAGNNLSPHWAIHFINGQRQEIQPSSGTHTLGWSIAHNNIAELYRDPGDEWEFHLRGKEEGATTLTLRVLHAGHSDFTTQPLPVLVDSSIHGEAEGLLIIDEQSDSTLVTATSQGVTGSLVVQRDSTTEHAVVYFTDGEGVRFLPAVPPHSLGYMVADTTRVQFIPAGAGEPWAFQLQGRLPGSTTVTFQLLAGGVPEWTSPAIPINVVP